MFWNLDCPPSTRSVVLWCLRTRGEMIQELPAHCRQVKAVQFSPDGRDGRSDGQERERMESMQFPKEIKNIECRGSLPTNVEDADPRHSSLFGIFLNIWKPDSGEWNPVSKKILQGSPTTNVEDADPRHSSSTFILFIRYLFFFFFENRRRRFAGIKKISDFFAI